ncbi:MAG TPA: purine-nucleoside phosphorylase [Candidatus Saccharimonadales bacterium]|nr:purine-nucleoside phosphorylase [Candidatus Saccharimonadales bacterium]
MSVRKNTGKAAAERSAARKSSTANGAALGEFERADLAASYILEKTALRPPIALVLGSGLGAFADEFFEPSKIPYADIPHFPVSTAIGHAGQLVIGGVGGTSVVAMQGRVHLYEGYSVKEVAFPIRVFARMGVKAVILTNAAGGIKREFSQGRLVVIKDHINLQNVNPLSGPNDERFGPRFPDMSTAYDRRFREMTVGEGNRSGIGLFEGVYAALPGPSYETPAEIRYLRSIGADLVGMSTVPEVIAARHCGIRVLGISCVTNAAAGILDQPLDHKEVLETAECVKSQFITLLRGVIHRIASSLVEADVKTVLEQIK